MIFATEYSSLYSYLQAVCGQIVYAVYGYSLCTEWLWSSACFSDQSFEKHCAHASSVKLGEGSCDYEKLINHIREIYCQDRRSTLQDVYVHYSQYLRK